MTRALRYTLALLVAGMMIHISIGQYQYGELAALWPSSDKFDDFALLAFQQATLPRSVMAILVGATLALVGSLFQQLTQNRLVSPLTLGTASGAWLGLVVLSAGFPQLVGQWSHWAALVGAGVAMLMVIAILGFRQLAGLPIILAGMAMNLLLGSIATAIILLNDQYANNLFLWGAGDLAQNGWNWVRWLLPKLSVAIIIIAVAPPILDLLKIGVQGAKARGLNTPLTFSLLSVMGVWLVSVSITTVGVISFIGLIAPNIVKMFSIQRARDELILSALMGAALLLFTDALSIFVGFWTLDIVPTGTATAFLGAPCLILLIRRKMKASDNLSLQLPRGFHRPIKSLQWAVLGLLGALCLLTLITHKLGSDYVFTLPDAFEWQLRWPRLLTALCAGGALALAGVLLQRMVYNPLASPDILGVSAGGVLALIMTSLVTGASIHSLSPWVAAVGSVTVLILLILLGKKHSYAPGALVVTGIALSATLDALVHFALTGVGEDKYLLLGWLSGSTYRVEPSQALTLGTSTLLLSFAAISVHKWMNLISAGQIFARARGLNLPFCYFCLLTMVAILCASVTTVMGPVAFVGLLAPHLAVLLGAREAKTQMTTSLILGATLMVASDFIGQWMLYPAQISAGILVSIIGGSYLLLLLLSSRIGRNKRVVV